MITGASLMLAFFACTQTPLGASESTVQDVKVVDDSWMQCMLGVLIKSNTHSTYSF